MRLWHVDLIDVLPRQQLLGQWRELNSIFKNQNRHVLIDFVYDYSKEHLYHYATRVINQMQKNHYKVDLTNFRNCFTRVDWLNYIPVPFPKKMTDRYLRQCYYNLQEKHDCGAIAEEEWKRIEHRCSGRV